MRPPLFVRPLTHDEHQAIRAGLRSPSAFTLRRAQILTASVRGLKPSEIRSRLGCSTQTVRNALRAFEAEGIACLHEKSHRPVSARPAIDDGRCEQLRALLHRSPRDFGKSTGVWTLALAAEVCHEQGLTERVVSIETIRQALLRLGIGWRRAKDWITSPDPAYARKKKPATG
jgi:transposase